MRTKTLFDFDRLLEKVFTRYAQKKLLFNQRVKHFISVTADLLVMRETATHARLLYKRKYNKEIKGPAKRGRIGYALLVKINDARLFECQDCFLCSLTPDFAGVLVYTEASKRRRATATTGMESTHKWTFSAAAGHVRPRHR